MPTYTFRSKTTGEVTEKFMKYSEREELLAQNPDLEIVITPISFTWGEGQPPSDFMKYVVDPIKKRNKSIFNSRDTRFKTPKEW